MSALDNNTSKLQEILNTVKSMPAVERHAVRYTEQELTEEQQEQARKNIGVDVPTIDLSNFPNLGAVNLYDGTNVFIYHKAEFAAEIIANPPERAKIILPLIEGSLTSPEEIRSVTINATLTQHESLPESMLATGVVCAYIGYIPSHIRFAEDEGVFTAYDDVAVIFGSNDEGAYVGVVRWTETDRLFSKDLQYAEKPKARARANIGAAGFIDVAELPTEIDKNAFYRVPKGSYYIEGIPDSSYVIYFVDTLPETGETFTDDDRLIFYYAKDTGDASVYVTSDTAADWGVPEGWKSFEEYTGDEYCGGVVYDVNDMTDPSKEYILIQSVLYDGDNVRNENDYFARMSDIPSYYFSIYEMGIPIISTTETITEVDTYAIRAALEKGDVRFKIVFSFDNSPTVPVIAKVSNAYVDLYNSEWFCIIPVLFGQRILKIVLRIGYGQIRTQLIAE